MTFDEYSTKAATTAKYHGLNYNSVGFGGEAGEYLNEYKKYLRNQLDGDINPDRRKMLLELGDSLWYMSQIASDLGSSLEEVAQLNLGKLQARYSN